MYYNIMITGERVKESRKGEMERMNYKRVVSANNLAELEERLSEIPEMAVIKESKGINSIERITSIKIA